MRFEVLTAMKMLIVVFWVVTLCSLIDGATLKIEEICSSGT
jgi:hypothetical protein